MIESNNFLLDSSRPPKRDLFLSKACKMIEMLEGSIYRPMGCVRVSDLRVNIYREVDTVGEGMVITARVNGRS